MVFVGSQILRLEERKIGGFKAWLDFSLEVANWFSTVLEEAVSAGGMKKRWPWREGESSFLCEIRENDAGKYLRIARIKRGDSNRSYALRIPCGDNGCYWAVLYNEINRLLEKNNWIQKPVKILPSREDFAPKLPRKDSDRKYYEDFVRIEGSAWWKKVAKEIRRQMEWEYFIDMKILDDCNAKLLLDKDCWLDL
ncbi:hypothetical protein C5167_031524 [Papaver somniferum]|uniref:Uncharacterized protein n=1 Tax=Papaver somniferum TaxID=3469 RepID=A0A4Y7K8E4_PAPSO|nr:hypothetical protein C5167_031524 [Papaver somniferum]